MHIIKVQEILENKNENHEDFFTNLVIGIWSKADQAFVDFETAFVRLRDSLTDSFYSYMGD